MPPGIGGFTADWRATIPDRDSRALSRETGYSRQELIQGHLEIFMASGGVETEGQEQHELFRDYLEFMVVGGHSQAERDAFWDELGIDPRDFDWEGWRELMGYSRDQ
jgi:hypothetical protein